MSKWSRARFRPAIDMLECRTMLSTFTVTNTQDSGTGSLRDAVARANSHSGADKIVFASQVSGTILLSSGPLTITDDVKISGPGAGQLTISGGNSSRVFEIDGGSFGGASKVTIEGLTITQGLATEDATFPASGGGILDLEADLTLKDDVLTANQAPLGGAGAMIYRGSLTASGSTWSNNLIIGGVFSGTVGSDTLFNEGSGVDLFASSASFSGCTFTVNSTTQGTFAVGGGISAEEAPSLSVSDSTFNGNQAFLGGAIYSLGVNTTVGDSSFNGNQAGFSGGAIEVDQPFGVSTLPMLNVSGSSFLGNQTGYSGGAISTIGAVVSVAHSSFLNNQAGGGLNLPAGQGGAISAQIIPFDPSDSSASLSISDSSFTGDLAFGPLPGFSLIAQGGAIWNQTTLTIGGSTFSDNTAAGDTAQGGAITDQAGVTVTISDTQFLNNQAQGQSGAEGGAIFDDVVTQSFQPGNATTITNCVFTGNTATSLFGGAGGAIASVANLFFSSNTLTIIDSTFTGNQAVGQPGQGFGVALAGAILSPFRSLSIFGSIFTGNEALGGDNSTTGQQGGQAEAGAISVYGANVSIDGSTFQSNVAQGGASTVGGGAATAGAILLGLWGGPTTGEISNSKFLSNQAIGGAGGVGNFFPIASSGGAISNFFFGGSLAFTDLTFEDNEAFGGDGAPGTDGNGAQGGAIYNGESAAILTIIGSRFANNLAQGGRGGDAAQLGGTAGNGGDGQGGGIYNMGVLSVTGSKLSGNSAIGGNGGLGNVSTGGTGGNGEGGGILTTEDPFFPGSASLTIDNSQITDNSAVGGFGGFGVPPGPDGQGLGGGIAILGGTTSIGNNTKVKGNHASTAGNDIYTAPGA